MRRHISRLPHSPSIDHWVCVKEEHLPMIWYFLIACLKALPNISVLVFLCSASKGDHGYIWQTSCLKCESISGFLIIVTTCILSKGNTAVLHLYATFSLMAQMVEIPGALGKKHHFWCPGFLCRWEIRIHYIDYVRSTSPCPSYGRN